MNEPVTCRFPVDPRRCTADKFDGTSEDFVPHEGGAGSTMRTETAEQLLPVINTGDETSRTAERKPMRLVALDIVRGFTVCVMIFVDAAGDTWERVDHAPWHGLTFADIVMPWFIFMVGNAMAFSLKPATASHTRGAQLEKLLIRTLKLFVLGLVLQGGGLPRHTWSTWGWDLSTIRVCGILQRIAFAYMVVGVAAIYVPLRSATGRPRDLLLVYAWQWLVPAAFALAYLVLMLATPVPDWQVANTSTSLEKGIGGATVECHSTVGDLGPACNAAGYYDRLLFGQAHLYQPGEKVRLPECSTCSPGQCWSSSTQPPTFCWAPFDPEGAVPCLMTVLTAFIGLHFGRAVHLARQMADPQRMLLVMWSASAAACAIIGLCLIPAFPVNKQLWTPSYALVNAAMTGSALILVYLACDVLKLDAVVVLLRPFQYVGMNALLVFVLAANDVMENLLDSIYWIDPKQNRLSARIHSALERLFSGPAQDDQVWFEPHGIANVLYVFGKIAFWLLICAELHRRRWYWKF